MHPLAVVQVALIQTAQQYFGGCNVGGDGYTVHVTQAEQVLLDEVAAVRLERVAEEQHQIDFVAGDARRDLLDAGRPVAWFSIRPVVPVAMTVLRERIPLYAVQN